MSTTERQLPKAKASKTIDVWVIVDENGDYVATEDRESLQVIYADNIGASCDRARRIIKVTLQVELPKPETLALKVPADGRVMASL
jgi:hypothetical protein